MTLVQSISNKHLTLVLQFLSEIVHYIFVFLIFFLKKMNAEKHFNTRNLYEILQISPEAEIQEDIVLLFLFINLYSTLV